ncbi:MAG: hypothetical protein ACJA2G_002036 [Cognaticolwellia sp.]|jgi:hypothetical protein
MNRSDTLSDFAWKRYLITKNLPSVNVLPINTLTFHSIQTVNELNFYLAT